jgi:hypothetical protein
LIEESGGRLSAFEIKWKSQKSRPLINFPDACPGSEYHILTREKYREFLV